MLRNFFKQIVRTPIKTCIFIVLIAFSTILLTLGIAMYISGDEELKKANKNFNISVSIENKDWIAGGYDPKGQSINLDEISPLLESPYLGYKSIQRNLVGRGENIDGFHNHVYEKVDDDTYPLSVFEIEVVGHLPFPGGFKIDDINGYSKKDTYYRVKVLNVLSGKEDLEDIHIGIMANDFKNTSEILEVGKRYIVNTRFIKKKAAKITFINGKTVDRIALYCLTKFYDNSTYLDGQDVKSYNAYEIQDTNYANDPNAVPYLKIASAHTNATKEFDISYNNASKDVMSFKNKEIFIKEGRDITDKEYVNRSKVCLISQQLKNINKLEIGDTISFKYRENNNDLIGISTSVYDLSHADSLKYYDDMQTYEIVGVYSGETNQQSQINSQPINYNSIFVPLSTFPKDIASNIYNSNMCSTDQLMLNLESIGSKTDFLLDLKNKNFDFDKYEVIINTNGVENIINTFKEMKQTSIVLIVSCLAVADIIIFFIVFLYISKRKTNTAIMVALGTKKYKIVYGFLFSIAIIVLIGSILGVVIGNKVAEMVINNAYKIVKEEMSTFGQMFSSQYSVHYAKNFDKTIEIPLVISVCIVGGILLVTLVMGSIAIVNNLKKEPLAILASKE